MTPDLHELANALLAAQCATGHCARDVDQLESVLRDRLYLMARNLIDDPAALLAALGNEHGLSVTQLGDPYSFIVGRDFKWGYYLPGTASGWEHGFSSMMDAARAGIETVMAFGGDGDS